MTVTRRNLLAGSAAAGAALATGTHASADEAACPERVLHGTRLEAAGLKPGKNRVYFMSDGYKLAGDLFLPADFDPSNKYPTIVNTRPGTQVKEQAGAVYGRKLADRGYVYLVFDPRNFGDSEGEVRNYESMVFMGPNTNDAIGFLRTAEFVDRDRFFGLGICAGAPYICNVALSDARVKAVATVAGNFDAARSLFGALPPEMLDQMMGAVAEGKQRYYETGEYASLDLYGSLPSPLPENAPTTIREAFDYYLNRASAAVFPNYSSEFPLVALPLDPARLFTSQAQYLKQPFLVIAGQDAFTREMDQEVFEIASEPKQYLEIEGASHMVLYDIDQYVDQAVDAIDRFYKQAV